MIEAEETGLMAIVGGAFQRPPVEPPGFHMEIERQSLVLQPSDIIYAYNENGEIIWIWRAA